MHQDEQQRHALILRRRRALGRSLVRRWPLVRGRQLVRRGERGQGLVEFALTVVFLTILLMGVLDLGRAYFSYLALKDAAQEGAYFGSAFPQCVDNNGINNDSPACADPNNVLYRVRHSTPVGGLVDMNDPAAVISVSLPCGSASPCVLGSGQTSQTVTVTVSYPYTMLTPFVGAIAQGQRLTLTAQSEAVIVRVPNCTVAPSCQ